MSRAPESPQVLLDGTWTRRGLVKFWEPEPAFDPRIRALVACPACFALLSEPCGHNERITTRRCPCGELPDGARAYCSTRCRDRAATEIALRRKVAA